MITASSIREGILQIIQGGFKNELPVTMVTKEVVEYVIAIIDHYESDRSLQNKIDADRRT